MKKFLIFITSYSIIITIYSAIITEDYNQALNDNKDLVNIIETKINEENFKKINKQMKKYQNYMTLER